jgi:hypothetical protein
VSRIALGLRGSSRICRFVVCGKLALGRSPIEGSLSRVAEKRTPPIHSSWGRAVGPASGVLVGVVWATLGVTQDHAMTEANIGGALLLLYAPVGVLCLLVLALAARLQPRLGRDDGRRELVLVAVDLVIGVAVGEQFRIVVVSGLDLAGAAWGLVTTALVAVPMIAVEFLVVDDLVRSKHELPPPPSTVA